MSQFLEILNRITVLCCEEYGGICGAIVTNDCEHDRLIDCERSVENVVNYFVKENFPEWHSSCHSFCIEHPDYSNPMTGYIDCRQGHTHISDHIEYQTRRRTIFNKMKEMHNLFTIVTPIDFNETHLCYRGAGW